MVTAYSQALEKSVEQFLEVAVSPYVKNYSPERREALLALLPADAKLLKFHQSLCPGCVDEEKFDKMKIDAVTYARSGKVWVSKRCEEHGVFRELSWSDYEMYRKAERFQDPGIKILNPNIDKSQFEIDCPTDCGLCVEHESHTGLGNVVVTNRCDLTCWYCLPFEEELLVKENGKVVLRKIGDLVEIGMKTSSTKITGGECTIPENMEVLTFKDGISAWTRVKRLYRRPFEGKLKKVVTKTGKTITVTQDHMFLVLSDAKIRRKTIDAIKPEDNLISVFKIPSEENNDSVDLIEGFEELPESEKGKLYVRGVHGFFTGEIKQKLEDAGVISNNMYAWKARDSMPFEAFSKLHDAYGDEEEVSLGVDGKDYTMPRIMKVTNEMAKLIGYFISDGHYAKGNLWITASEKSFEDIRGLLEKLGLSHSIQDYEGKTKQIVIGNSVLAKMFEHVFKIPRGAANKRLPSLAFDLPMRPRLALLTGLFNGDGYVVRGSRHASLGYATVSKGLARDVLYLLSTIGIFARVYRTRKEKVKGANFDIYKLYIAGKDMENLISMLALRKGHMKRLENLSRRRAARIERLGDFVLDAIKTVEDADAQGQFVYDLEVEDRIHGFIAGDGILVSNCFFYAKEGEPIYEPTMDQIKFMLQRMKNEKPVGCNSVQFTGGEPTIREDLPDIIRAAKELSYDHVQLNTNGINLSRDPQLAVRLREAGVSNLYMSFDGMSPQTNPKNYWEAQSALENCHKAGIGVVLVPTVIGGVNDHELGDIIRFGMKNLHVVRSTNFQPVSLVGRMPEKLRKRQRITIPGAIKRIEEQTDGQIGREDFFPVPCAKQITDFIESVKQEPKYRLSIHFQCGMATYAFKDGNSMVPITRFFDIEGFFEYLAELTKEIRTSKHRKITTPIALAKLALNLKKYVDEEKKPKNLNFVKVMRGAVQGGNYHGLADFHNNSLFIGMMHFQDPYNWDIDRIHKCDIHYATPDGRILPFCTFNVIPELYRDRIQRKFSIPAGEWEKRTGKKLGDDKHHRKLTPEEMRAIKANYDKCRRLLMKPELEPDWGDEEIAGDDVLKEEIAARLQLKANDHVQTQSHGSGFIPLEQMLGLAGASRSGISYKKKATMENPAGGCGSCGCGG